MATVKDIYRYMDQKAPFDTQEGFDNSGLLVGWEDAAVQTVLISLDITQQVIEEAAQKRAQLIVSHHPVIFYPAKRITDAEPTGQLVMALIQYGLAAICAHTNLDKAPGGVNDALAAAAGLQQIRLIHSDGTNRCGLAYGIGRYGLLTAPGSLADYLRYLKKALGANGLRYADGGKPVYRVAVGGGACGGMLREVAALGCDTFITADVKHDQFLEARALGLNLVDAGHYSSEHVVCPVLERWLREGFPELTILQSEADTEPTLYL